MIISNVLPDYPPNALLWKKPLFVRTPVLHAYKAISALVHGDISLLIRILLSYPAIFVGSPFSDL